MIILLSLSMAGCKSYPKDSAESKYYWLNKFYRASFNPNENTQGIYYYSKIKDVSLVDSSFFAPNQLAKPFLEARFFYLKISVENIEVYMQEAGMRDMSRLFNAICNDTIKLTDVLKSRNSRMGVDVFYYPILNPKEIKDIQKIIKKNKPVLILVNPGNPHDISTAFAYAIYTDGKFDVKRLLPYETIFKDDFDNKLVLQGGVNKAVNNVIFNFAKTSKLFKKDSIFHISIEENNSTYIMTIGGAINKVYPQIRHKLGAVDKYKVFPTNYKVLNGKLFYWSVSGAEITQEIFDVLTQFNHIDFDWRDREYNIPLGIADGEYGEQMYIPPLIIDDGKQTLVYYVCKNNFKKHKKVKGHYLRKKRFWYRSLGKTPKLECY
jgi:hypothetical protein